MAVSSFSTLKAALRLTGLGTLNRNGVSGVASLGINTGDISLDPGILQTVKVTMGAGATAIFDGGGLLVTTSEATGASQSHYAEADGTATQNGNLDVAITSAIYPAASKAIIVPVLSGDTSAAWAAKVRAALTADPDINGAFLISGSGSDIYLTDRLQNDNDLTCNIAIGNATPSPGIVDVPTSTEVVEGFASVAFEDNNADYQGRETISSAGILAYAFALETGSCTIEETNGTYFDTLDAGPAGPSDLRLLCRSAGLPPAMAENDLTITATAPNTVLAIHVAARTI